LGDQWADAAKHIITMKYLCLVYMDEENWNAGSDIACGNHFQQLAEAGQVIAGEPLHPVHTATTLRKRDGQLSVTDGPFAETKEMLAGFWLIEAADLNEAIKIGAALPSIDYGTIEVRPVRELKMDG
jgi:hypothetical protein